MKTLLIIISVMAFTFITVDHSEITSAERIIADDIKTDIHHEAGMGCIDCHGSYDMHAGMQAYIKIMVNVPNDDFNLPKVVKGLGKFLATHTADEAAAKSVDYQLIVDFMNNQ